MTRQYTFARPSFLSGVARLMDFGCTFDGYNSSHSTMEADVRAAVSDWFSVGDDIKAAVAKLLSDDTEDQ